MDPISNVDQLVLLLRQRLLERSRAERGGRKVVAPKAARRPATLDPVQVLVALDGADDRQLERALIQNLLTEQLGRGLLNDARFQLVVDQVTETLRQDAHGKTLLAQLTRELRAAGGG